MKRTAGFEWKLVALVTLLTVVLASSGLLASTTRNPQNGCFKVIASTESFCVDRSTSTQRMLRTWFYSERRAPPEASVELAIPRSLGLGESLPFRVLNVQPGTGPRRKQSLHYWGCWSAPPPGQPLSEESVRSLESPWPEGSCGRPGDLRHGSVAPDARAGGRYALRAPYLGDVVLDLGDEQEFLDAIVVVAPPSDVPLDPSRPFRVSWAPLPRALGYSVAARGQDATGNRVVWEYARDGAAACTVTGPSNALREGRLVAGDECIVPGLFHGPVTVTITAYSPEARSAGRVTAVGWAQSTLDLEITTP